MKGSAKPNSDISRSSTPEDRVAKTVNMVRKVTMLKDIPLRARIEEASKPLYLNRYE